VDRSGRGCCGAARHAGRHDPASAVADQLDARRGRHSRLETPCGRCRARAWRSPVTNRVARRESWCAARIWRIQATSGSSGPAVGPWICHGLSRCVRRPASTADGNGTLHWERRPNSDEADIGDPGPGGYEGVGVGPGRRSEQVARRRTARDGLQRVRAPVAVRCRRTRTQGRCPGPGRTRLIRRGVRQYPPGPAERSTTAARGGAPRQTHDNRVGTHVGLVPEPESAKCHRTTMQML
jgi:hypothetical protein